MKPLLLFSFLLHLFFPNIFFGTEKTKSKIDELANTLEPKLIEWRRHFHQFPELGNREFKTSEKIAKHLQSLGMEVQTKIAHTGVVGILKGGKPGKVVALRADMDGLPVIEEVDVAFASKEKGNYNGKEVGVMHACGHDTHIAIMMTVAEVLSSMKNEIRGTVKFIFQPAEEGVPDGEEGGAAMMVKEGVLQNPNVDAAFALHIDGQLDVGNIEYRAGAYMASSDVLKIVVKGKQTHGAYPWNGVDPIVTSAQIITGLQTIVSRQIPLTTNIAVVTIGSIHGGNRSNIIPGEVEMVGTIRALDTAIQHSVHEKIQRTVKGIAESAGATAEVTITKGYPVTINDVELTTKMIPTLSRVAGENRIHDVPPRTGAEDFSFIALKVPGFYFSLGGKPLKVKKEDTGAHHSPKLFIDESGMKLGVRAMCNLAIDFLEMDGK